MSFLRKGMLVSGAHVVDVAVGLAAGIILSRTLGPDGMGQYELFRTTAVMAATMMALGFGNAHIYFLNKEKIEPVRVTTNAVKVGAAGGLVLLVGLTVVVQTWAGYFGAVSWPVALAFGVGAAGALNTALLRPVIVAELAARRIAIVDLSNRVALVVSVVALALAGLITAEVAIVIFAGSHVATLGVVLYFVRRYIDLRRPLEWPLVWRVLGYGIKLAAANVLFLVATNITVLLLRWFNQDDFDEVGLFTRAAAVAMLVKMLPTKLGQLLYAKFSASEGETRRRQVEMACRMNVAYGLVACGALLIGGQFVLWLLYGPEFIPAQAALDLLAPAVVFTTLFMVCNNLLAGDGRAAITAWILAGTVIIVTGVTFLAVPLLGIRGAALAVLCGNFFTAAVSLAVCWRLYGVRVGHCLVMGPADVRYVRDSLSRRSPVAPPPQSEVAC